MSNKFIKFFFNYLPNISFMVFISFIVFMILVDIIDAMLGSQLNAAIADTILSVISNIGAFVAVASVIQWMSNLIVLSKANIDDEVKSKWRYYMFLFFIFANVDFYEAFVADQETTFKKTRNFLRIKSTSMFHP